VLFRRAEMDGVLSLKKRGGCKQLRVIEAWEFLILSRNPFRVASNYQNIFFPNVAFGNVGLEGRTASR